MAHIFLSNEVFALLDAKSRQSICLSIETLFNSMGLPGRPFLIVALETDVTPEEVSDLFSGEVKHILPLDEIQAQEA